MEKFKVGDMVIVCTNIRKTEVNWIGVVTKTQPNGLLLVDMSSYGIYASPIGYSPEQVRLLTKLDKALK